MKKYIDYKVGLCIGLLSLHTLSGCVSTRKELGWRPRLDTIWGSMSRWSDRNPKKAIAAKALAGVYTIGTIAGICYGVSHFWGSSKTSLGYINNNNGSMPFNTTASPDGNTITFPYTNLTTTEIAQMTQGIEDGKEKWGTNETFTDDTTITTNSTDTVDDSSTTESTTSTTIEDTSIPTTTSTTTSEDSSTIESTTSISSTKLTTDDGIPPIENPMVLDDRVLEDLKSSNFSEESIKNWLAKGLDKNAKTENGDTLLFEAAYQPSEDAVKYLLQIPGIDLSVKGYVDILQWAVSNGYSGIAKLILEAKLGKLDSKDETGNNLVHMTAKGGFVNVLDELAPYVDAQKLQEKNNDDKTPLEVAEENDHQPFVDALKKLINSSEK